MLIDTEIRHECLQRNMQQCSFLSHPEAQPPACLLDCCNCIRFSAVTFEDRGHPKLQRLSTELPLGSCMALGPTDALGHSSFLKLACGMNIPDAGSVLIPPFARCAYVDRQARIIACTRDKNLLLHEPFSHLTYSYAELQSLRQLFGLGVHIEATGSRSFKRYIDELFHNTASMSPEDVDVGVNMSPPEAGVTSLLRVVLSNPDILCIDGVLQTVPVRHRRRLELLIGVWYRFGMEGLLRLAGDNTDSTGLDAPPSSLPRTVIWSENVSEESFIPCLRNVKLRLHPPTRVDVKVTDCEHFDLTQFKRELDALACASDSSFDLSSSLNRPSWVDNSGAKEVTI